MRVGVISVVGDFHGERLTSSSNIVPDLVLVGVQIARKPRRSFPPALISLPLRGATLPNSSSRSRREIWQINHPYIAKLLVST